MMTQAQSPYSPCGARASSRARQYLAAAVGILIFSLIYEAFSHGVISWWMLGAFLPCLALGWLPAQITKKAPPVWPDRLRGWGISCLTAGMILEGIYEIYGTAGIGPKCYLAAGGLMYLAGVLTGIFRKTPAAGANSEEVKIDETV